jgi:hypothetical protein
MPRQDKKRDWPATVTCAIGAGCLTVALVALGGCFSFETAYLANGTKVVRIGCSLAVDGYTRCYKTAGDLCGPRGYVLFDWDGKPWALPYPDPASLENDAILASTALLVACRS